jgi:hypothetical protein
MMPPLDDAERPFLFDKFKPEVINLLDCAMTGATKLT